MRIAMALLASAIMCSARSVSTQNDDGARLFQRSSAVNVIVFVTRDCPISNGYAPAIQRLCRDYGPRGLRCTLVYEDGALGVDAVRDHLREYGYGGFATMVDGDGRLAARVGATVTPEAAVIDTSGTVRYRGRIDNFYAALGKPRHRATSHDLREAIDAVLAGRAVTRPRTTALGCYIPSRRPNREVR